MLEAVQLARQHDAAIRAARGEAEADLIAEAERVARRLHREAEDPADLSFAIDLFKDDPRLVNALLHGGTVRRRGVKLSEAVERHAEGRDEKPFTYALKSFQVVHGDPDITTITRQDVRDWLGHENRRGLKASTVRRRLDALQSAVGRAYLDADLAQQNPFARHNVRGGRGSPSDRVPFHRSHLELIDAYLETAPRLKPNTRDLLRLLRWTGAGTAEIAGLEVGDVVLEHPIPHLWIRPNTLRGLKTASRDRHIPLLPPALEAAQDALERTRGPSLFTGYGRGGRGADHLSATLNAALRRAGIPASRRLSVYSFRHVWAEALRAAGVQEDLRRRLLGHSSHSIPSRYGADRAQLADALAAMEAATPHLGDIDRSVYREGELA